VEKSRKYNCRTCPRGADEYVAGMKKSDFVDLACVTHENSVSWTYDTNIST
jgi:hypothetical protein